jgi:integrase
MRELYQEYLKERAGTWSATSAHSESYRLNRLWPFIDGDAAKLWDALKDYGAYSRTTYWTRVSSFYDWAIEAGKAPGPNPYKAFRQKNVRCFRNQYVRKPCEITFDELLARSARVPDEAIRNKLRQLLIGGLRISESDTLADGHVVGKGGKRRKVYVPEPDGPMATVRQYSAVLRACKRHLGVTPHKLRSARMTDLVDKGATIFELKKFAGWSNISTAESYVYARDERLQELAEQRTNSLMSKIMGWAKAKVTV